METARMSGRLEVICGPMFSGKTTELIRRVEAARGAQRRVVVVKPTCDDRYARDAICTHYGARLAAQSVEDVRAVLALANGTEVIAIDEVHFFGAPTVNLVAQVLALDLRIIVSGCDIDHFGDPFDPFHALLPMADEIVRMTGICSACGNPSTHTQRLFASRERISVGGHEQYAPRCAGCFTPSAR